MLYVCKSKNEEISLIACYIILSVTNEISLVYFVLLMEDVVEGSRDEGNDIEESVPGTCTCITRTGAALPAADGGTADE